MATSSATKTEQRTSRRFALKLPVSIRCENGEITEVPAETRDVSAQGVFFYTGSRLSKGSKVEFTLTLPPDITLTESIRVRCRGRIVRIGDIYASDATVKGSVRYTATGLEVGNGSVITAGQHSASVRLARGGQVRICPGTNLTVNSSPKGQELMFAMSAGSLEGEYDLPATADAILTPDFRILISGPAKVDVSISAQANGDACVRSRGEDSSVIVSELIGDAC